MYIIYAHKEWYNIVAATQNAVTSKIFIDICSMAEKCLHVAYDACYAHNLPEEHRFPMLKYELIPGQLLHEGTLTNANFFSPGICKDEVVLLTHTPQYFDKLKLQQLSAKEQREIGFPQSPALTHRELQITQGTIDCAMYALKNGVALNVAGGTHHAFAERGEGFCLLNDFAIASNYLLREKILDRIMVVDLDVHQGNGTASIFKNEPRVFTFSMHGQHNYPFRKEESDLDVGLPDGIEDEAYLDLLTMHLHQIIAVHRPQLVCFQAGVDILHTDKYGKLNISLEGCKKRDELVLNYLKESGIPCVLAMGGGYSADIRIIVEAHCNSFRAAKLIYDL